MRKIALSLLAATFAAPACAQAVATLPAVFARAQTLARQAPKGRHFELFYARGRWHFFMNPNPPGSGLLLDLTQGETVRLTLTNEAFNDVDEEALFDIDAVNVHVFLESAGDQTEVSFTAPKEGIYFITEGGGVIGRMVVRKG